MISLRARCSGDARATEKVDDGVTLCLVGAIAVLLASLEGGSRIWPPQEVRLARATASTTVVAHLAAVIVPFLDVFHKELGRLWRSASRMVENASRNSPT